MESSHVKVILSTFKLSRLKKIVFLFFLEFLETLYLDSQNQPDSENGMDEVYLP